MQAIWDTSSTARLGAYGARTAHHRLFKWQPQGGSWAWCMSGQTEPLHFIHNVVKEIQHWVRKGLCCHVAPGRKVGRSATFKRLEDEADKNSG